MSCAARTSPRGVWLALVLALAGLATVARIWSDTGLDGAGVAAGLGAACCLAAFYLLSKHTIVERRLHSLTLSFWMFATASLFWAVAQPWWDFDLGVLGESVSLLGALEDVTVPLWLPVAWIIVLATLVPYALSVAALVHLSPTATGIVGMGEPVVAATVAWVWLGQSLTPSSCSAPGSCSSRWRSCSCSRARRGPVRPGRQLTQAASGSRSVVVVVGRGSPGRSELPPSPFDPFGQVPVATTGDARLLGPTIEDAASAAKRRRRRQDTDGGGGDGSGEVGGDAARTLGIVEAEGAVHPVPEHAPESPGGRRSARSCGTSRYWFSS